ncbi:DUF47 family protein, partial [Thermococcus sp. GR4]|uniref:DUF47 family protein n=1 Tax=Thermococcus sp. GR4 TaxID=1638254 RepID=UPI00197CCA40
ELRPHQREFIDLVSEAVRNGENAIIEAPTGFGKTVSVLAGILPYAREMGYKVLYLARTHRQMDRVIESGFAENEIAREYELIRAIEDVESKIDGLDTRLMKLVFENADKLDWGTGFCILNIARTISNISDKAKDAAE